MTSATDPPADPECGKGPACPQGLFCAGLLAIDECNARVLTHRRRLLHSDGLLSVSASGVSSLKVIHGRLPVHARRRRRGLDRVHDPNGPAQLRLIHQDGRTITDLSCASLPPRMTASCRRPERQGCCSATRATRGRSSSSTSRRYSFQPALVARWRKMPQADANVRTVRKSVCRRAYMSSPSRRRVARCRSGSLCSLQTRPGPC